MMNRQPLSLKVVAAYARDTGTGVIRIDHKSMNALGVIAGDTVEIIGKKDGFDAKCLPLLPSDEDRGITRVDPNIRKIIGVSLEDTVIIRNITPVSRETIAKSAQARANIAEEEEQQEEEQQRSPPSRPSAPIEEEEDNTSVAPEIAADETAASAGGSPVLFVLSGSCLDFEKERSKLMAFIAVLESASHGKSRCRCYSDGKKALGWDFFLLEVDQDFVERLRDVYPDIDKQEAGMIEERFALWLNKQLKKMKLDFHLKLNNISQEKVGGFRLDPNQFRDKAGLDDLK